MPPGALLPARERALPGGRRQRLGRAVQTGENQPPTRTQIPARWHVTRGNKNLERFLFIQFLVTLAGSPGNVELEERYLFFFSLSHQRGENQDYQLYWALVGQISRQEC